MKIESAEKLYLRHAEDFRALLGTAPGTGAVAMVDNRDLEAPAQVGGTWFQRLRGGACRENLHSSIAIAAMTEAWRERPETEHGVVLYRSSHTGWRAQEDGELLDDTGCWVGPEYNYATFISLPEAICAVVEFLAKEKRAAQKPSAAAMRAAKRILEAQAGVNPPAIARIIDEELAWENP